LPAPTGSDDTKGKYNIRFDQSNIGFQHVGDVTTSTYSPTGNVTATITIDNRHIENMPKEYADSLQKLADLLNSEFKKNSIPPQLGAPIQARVNELSGEATKLNQGTVDEATKKGIKEKLRSLAVALAKASPTIAKTIIGFTPLAPFSGLIGDAFESMVQGALDS
jgi:hypothetical protein